MKFLLLLTLILIGIWKYQRAPERTSTSRAELVSGTSGIEISEGNSDPANIKEVSTQHKSDCSPEHDTWSQILPAYVLEWIVLVGALRFLLQIINTIEALDMQETISLHFVELFQMSSSYLTVLTLVKFPFLPHRKPEKWMKTLRES